MIKKVYVPLDGSEMADAAIQPAAQLALRAGAHLVLLACRWPGTSDSTMRAYLDAHVGFLDGPVDAWLISDEQPAEAIADAGSEPGALVCMATRGLGSIRSAVLGSVAEEVLRSSTGTLALMGPNFDPTWALPEEPVIVVGVDGSAESCAAALAAGDVAEALDARVELVRVFDPIDEAGTRHAHGVARGISDLAMLADPFRDRGVKVTATPLDGFDPAPVLLLHARQHGGSLLAVGSRGRSGLSRVAFGSTACSVARHAPFPVLVTGPRWGECRPARSEP